MIVTIVVLLGFWSMAYRETASLIRVESARLLSQTRSVQSVHAMTALDRALTLLEVKLPTNRQIYTYTVNVTPSEMFTVTFTPATLPGANNGWTVQVTPLSSGSSTAGVPALPRPGDSPQWPSSP